MNIQSLSITRIRFGQVSRAVVISLALATFAGCASLFNLQVLYEAPQPGSTDGKYVMRLEKEQDPISGTTEEFPARPYNISEERVREMMDVMYRRFFKDPATFVPPNETFGEDPVDAVVDSAVDNWLGRKKKPKDQSASYRPRLREDGHPASMSRPRRVFSPQEIDAFAPELVKAFAELRKGEHLTVRTRAFDSEGRGGSRWRESQTITSVAVRFQAAGRFLGITHGASISWEFYRLHGLHFRGKGDTVYTYSCSDSLIPEEFDFLAVFPRKEANTTYWRVEFPVE